MYTEKKISKAYVKLLQWIISYMPGQSYFSDFQLFQRKSASSMGRIQANVYHCVQGMKEGGSNFGDFCEYIMWVTTCDIFGNIWR